MNILGIETSCDETAAAVVTNGWDVRSNVLASSLELPAAEIAGAAIDDCRSFAGDLADDCAIVVIKRS